MMEQKVTLSVQGDFTEPHLCQLLKQLLTAGFEIGEGKEVNSSQFPYIAVDSTGDAQNIRRKRDVLFLSWKRADQTLPAVKQATGKRNYWLILIAVPALCCEVSWCRDVCIHESPKTHVTIQVPSCTRSQNIILFLEKEQENATEL